MGGILAVVKIGRKTGVPADVVENTFAFSTAAAPTTTDRNNVKSLVTDFYTLLATGATNTVQHWLGSNVDTGIGKSVIEQYDISGALAGGPHGGPIQIDNLLLGPVGTAALPAEVSLCLSFHSAYGTDAEFGVGTRPKARDRGRIFLGPIAANALSNDATTGESVVNGPPRADICGTANRLITQSALDLVPWCVWSRKKAALSPVVGGWMDDQPDTQRRRGTTTRVRTSFGG